MKLWREVNYNIAFAIALGMHCLLFAMFANSVYSGQGPAVSLPAMVADKEIIKAVTVDAQAVAREVKALQVAHAQAERRAQAKQRHRQAQIRQAQRQRRREQQRLKALQRELAKAKLHKRQQEKRAQQALRKLNQQQAQVKKQLQQADAKRKELASATQKEQAQLQAMQRKRAQMRAREKAIAEQQQREQAERAQMLSELAHVKAQHAVREKALMEKYKARVLQAIASQWIFPPNVDKQLSSRWQIRLGPGGVVLDAKLLASSQDPLLDRSAKVAIFKASPLPVPQDRELFAKFRVFNLTVRPERVLSTG